MLRPSVLAALQTRVSPVVKLELTGVLQASRLQTASSNIAGLLDSSAAYITQLEHNIQDQIQHLVAEVEQGLCQN